MDELLTCPFCGEMDFDLIGLKLHLMMGHCSAYNETPTTDAPAPTLSEVPAYRNLPLLFGSGLRDVQGAHVRAARNRRSPPSAPRAEAVEAPPELGDTVRHIPTGEQWLVAYIKDGKLSACGWPDERVPASDCVLVSRMPLRKKLNLLRDLSRSTGHRADYARALLESAYLTVGAAIAQGADEGARNGN